MFWKTFIILSTYSFFSVHSEGELRFEFGNCGDWTEFGEQKCIKIKDKQSFVDYKSAVDLCSKTDNSGLLTIHSKQEQEFIEKYLFGKNSIVDNVWIGLKNETEFKWSDKTAVDYTNWAEGSPKYRADRECVQMLSEDSLVGKWAADSCLKKGLVVCQKNFSFDVMKKTIIKLKETSDQKTSEINVLKKKIENLNKENQVIENRLKDCRQNGKSGGLFKKYLENNSKFSTPFIDDNGKEKIIFITWEKDYPYGFGWDEANKQCEDLNSNLIEIRSEKKKNIFDSALKQMKLTDKYYFELWLHARRDTVHSDYYWISDGQKFNYTHWKIDPTGMNTEPAPYPGLLNVMADYGAFHLTSNKNPTRTHPDSQYEYTTWKTAYPTHSFYAICEHEF